MATVQLQCGNCRKVMGILAEHLGGQVQCPHCRAVVRTPPRPAAVVAPASAPTPAPPPDLFDEQFHAPDPLFESPEVVEVAEEPADVVAPTIVDAPHETESADVSHAEPAVTEDADDELTEVVEESPPLHDEQTDLTSFQRKPLQRPSLLPAIFMIFLVPYAILSTLVIIYLLTKEQPKSIHPLDVLPDPKKQGGPRRVQIIHNHELAPHQMAALNETIRVGKDGDLEITPLHVRLTELGDLELVLRARNISKNLKFEPINDFYLRYSPSKENEGIEGKLYSFLESESKSVENIYGGTLEYHNMVDGKEVRSNVHELGPQEEELLVITTMPNFQKLIKENIAQSNDSFVWRVQLRRGFVKYEDKEISATAVIGVKFTPQNIEKPG